MDPVSAPPSMPPVSLPPYAQLPAYASTSAASITAPPAAAPESKRTVTRLPKEALEILRAFHRKFGTSPTTAQKDDLVEQVHRVQGGEFYTREHVSRYFANKRRDAKLAGQAAAKSASQTLLWPSLTKQKIERLRGLWKEKPNPSRKVISIWAQSLDAEEAHIIAWLAYQSDDDDDDGTPATDGQREQTHLPTPEPTASPEPFIKMGNSPPATPIQPNYTFFPPSTASSFQAAPPGRHYAPTSHVYPTPAVAQLPPLSSIPCQPPQHLQSQPPTPVSPVAHYSFWPPNAAQRSSSLKPNNTSPVAAAPVPQAPPPASPVPAPVQKPAPPAPSREELLRRRMQSVARDVMSRAGADDKEVLSLPEYDAQYASVLERECTEFLSKAESGRYASLGLKATMVPSRAAFEERLRTTA